MYLLETNKLVKAYNSRRVVNSVSITVKPGEIVGLLGPNGAGKTTTFYMIVGLVNPDEGHIMFKDRFITPLPMHKRARSGIGYLSQEPSIFRKLTVEENILAILETCKLSSKERKKRLSSLLSDLGLMHLAKNKADTLSGGERRRLEVTRALVTNPKLILLDEPFSGIDPIAVFDVQQIIIKLRERGIGILLTDHNVRETLSITDRAYLIAKGEVLIQGTAKELINDTNARKVYLGEKFSM